MRILSLNGEYCLRSENGRYKCRAEIPGSDIASLFFAGLMCDPLNAPDGEEQASKVSENSFIFEREFEADASLLKSSNAVLCCEKLDTLCTVSLNGTVVLTTENAHIAYRAQVGELLRPGKNEISFRFESPLNYIKKRQKERPFPPNSNGVNGAQYLRKANCAFGWDWGPCVPYNYIGNVELRFFESEIENIRIRQKTDEKLSVVTVSADGAESCYILTPDGKRIDGEGFTFEISDPELWYTRDLSEKSVQPLYTVVLENGEMTEKRRLGLRSIALNTKADEWGSNFQFVLNGKRVFAKGANVIPFAALPEYADEKSVDYYLELAAKSNFNMLRVWGGGEYASEHFLERCDELGILVWQDFCFACMMYPLDDADFLENVLAEARYNIERIENHACLALWCGNNEIEDCNPVFPKISSVGKAYVKFFYETLPTLVGEIGSVPYIPTSPVGKAPFKDNTSENLGDSHMWAVWHGLKPLGYYGTRYARFLSEFGMESLPSKKAVERFDPGEKSIYDPCFMKHQKCSGGNRKLMFYLCEKFGSDVDFYLLPYLTGILQSECIRAATEHFRRCKGRCNGSVFWQYNDVWNAPSWSAVDFEKVPKALMYKAREFFAPFTLSFDNGELYLLNDTLSDKTAHIDYSLFCGRRLKWVYSETLTSPKDSVTHLRHITLGAGDILKVTLNGERFVFDNVQKLENALLTAVKNGNSLVISSDCYARNICVESDETADKNYFSLLPGESETVTFEKMPESFRLLCENNVEFTKKSLKKSLFRLGYRLKPENLVRTLWYDLH